ncbi:hypothetical protein MPSEU_000321600 [Mayamaea pseudoterrestris]|nr:hypothetical protein MPSEU_000321600 [Mayamaea pseudoterrestris]
MGASEIYGTDIDILYWDSGMTEMSWQALDLFLRASIISEGKVPVSWGSLAKDGIRQFALNTGADVAIIGGGAFGMLGIPKTASLAEVESIPWAARYLDCTLDVADECQVNKYLTKCWVDRPDFIPPTDQAPVNTGSQVSWHPGWRTHQLNGRVLAFALLRATRQALKRWKEADGYILPDEAWHVTSLYETIRSKTLSFESEACLGLPCPDLFCKYPMKAKTEFTPKVGGYESSIRSIMKLGGVIRRPPPNVYDPPDVRLPFAEVPEGAADAVNIIENGIDFVPNLARIKHTERLLNPVPYEFKSQNYITPGNGTWTNSNAAPDNCDGTWDSFCNRFAGSNCLLIDHNDGRNGLLMDGLSGWIVLDIANVEKGLIVVKIETWHNSGENLATTNWTCANNDCPPERQLQSTTFVKQTGSPSQQLLFSSDNASVTRGKARRLKPEPPKPCEAFRFEFAIDGKITSWTNEEFEARRTQIARVVATWTLLDDPSYVADGAKDIELAIRITGCGNFVTHSLTHVYWA